MFLGTDSIFTPDVLNWARNAPASPMPQPGVIDLSGDMRKYFGGATTQPVPPVSSVNGASGAAGVPDTSGAATPGSAAWDALNRTDALDMNALFQQLDAGAFSEVAKANAMGFTTYSITNWLNDNKTLVYLGAGLVALFILIPRR